MAGKSFREKVIGKFPCLFEAIDPFIDFKVHPPIVDVHGKVVFINEFLGNIIEFDADILRAI